MADNYINFAWIIQEPLERSRKFIYFGLGQEKLILEHRRNQLRDEGEDPESDLLIQHSQEWLDFQQYEFLTTVDMSGWSGKSVYQMAQEAGCKDFYNYVYQPFSVAAHNMWNHIGRHNMQISTNPLHKFLLIPRVSNIDIQFNYPKLAAKYVNKLFVKFHENYGIDRSNVNSYKELLSGYELLVNKTKDLNKKDKDST